ncbi:MAG: molecular chaperone DnaJ [Hydrotalea sp.]|nr:molecular chaperone DnaJ [Hydrotalea sp.]
MAKRDYYDILGVARGADDAALKAAYRKKAMASHPDRNRDNPKAAEEFQEINEAYEVLRDAQKRAAYDQFGHAAFQQGGPGGGRGGAGGGFQGGFGGFGNGFPDINDIFEQMFGGGFQDAARGARRRETRGRDRELQLTINLLQAFRGDKIKIRAPRLAHCKTCDGSGAEKGSGPTTCKTCNGHGTVRTSKGFFSLEQTCPKCRGTGQVIEKPCKTCHGAGLTEQTTDIDITIPPGIDNRNQVRVQGKGDDAPRGGKNSGDLFLHIHITPHDIFERNGNDLFYALPVDAVTAMTGGEVAMPTIDGNMAVVKIDKGVESGQQFRLKGKGMVVLNSGGRRGDMIVSLAIETPKHLSAAQEKLLVQWAELSEKTANTRAKQLPKSTAFIEKAQKFIDNYPK